MRVNSTGLGKTTLIVKITGLSYEYREDEGWHIKFGMESKEPVSWIMQARLFGPDLRDAVKAVLKLIANPIRLFKCIKLLMSNPSPPKTEGKGQPSLGN